MSEDTTYNGWKNYPTWAVNLWLGNEEVLYDRRCELAGMAIADANEDENVISKIWTVEQAQRYRLADDLKKWVVDELAPDLGATFAADLLGYALGEVDWHEIAAAAIEDVQ